MVVAVGKNNKQRKTIIMITEEIRLGILHNVNGYYVSNEGTKKNQAFMCGFQALRTLIVIVPMVI